MISVEQASALILSNLYKPKARPVAIQQAVGLVLAETIVADRDLPPFNRVTMDGIAIQFETWQEGRREFFIERTMAAGELQKKMEDAQNAVEVMTGAVLPLNTDAVIRYEDIRLQSPYATIESAEVEAWQNIHRQGKDAKKGDRLLSPGMVLSPAEIALLASVGKSEVLVNDYPETAVVAGGDELVEIQAVPFPHQVRRSNTYAIEAAMKILGWPCKQFHFPDEKQKLKESLETILNRNDVVILSGGVSQGKFDFIPEVMQEIGVKKIFHQVSQRPGKPFWFGVSPAGKVVFALPGNPVSTFMCFFRYIKPWILKSLGVELKTSHAILAADFAFPPRLTYFLQVGIRNEEGKLMAYPNAGGGSGDFANLKNIDGFLELPANRQEFRAGEVFPFIAFRL